MTAAWIVFALTLTLVTAVGVASAIVAGFMTRGQRRPPLDDVAWAGLPVQHLRLAPRGGGPALAASLVAASEATRAVVFVHGKDCSRGSELKTSTHALVKELHDRGFAVLMIDLRGHGESAAARMSYGLHERHDVLGAVDWLLARGFAAHHIGLFGASMGGACAIGALAQDPQLVGPLVLDSSFADFDAMMKSNFSRLSGMPRWLLAPSLWWSRRYLNADLRRLRPADELARCSRRPLLVVHARNDPFVAVHHAHALARAGDGGLWITEGRHHLSAYRDAPALYLERVAGFFEAHLVVAPLAQRAVLR
jgi:pimeloyl-ACP methyl ester carboxylesterase